MMKNTATIMNFRGRVARGAALAVATLATLGTVSIVPTALAHGTLTVPSGTSIQIRVETDIRSTNNGPGDPFRAVVTTPVVVGGEEAIPTGSKLSGVVDTVQPARSWGQPSGVTLRLDTLTSPSGASVDVNGFLGDLNGNRMATVENLTRGTDLVFRTTRPISVDESFYMGEDGGQENTALVRVSAADAAVHPGNQLHVRIQVTNASGLQLAEQHRRVRDVVEVTVTGYPVGGTRQATKELNLVLRPDEWQGARRIVIHNAGPDVVIDAREFDQPGSAGLSPTEAAALQQQLSTLLSSYARGLGIRYVPFTGQLVLTRANYNENDIELLFALNSLVSTSRLYTQLLNSTTDPQAIDGASDLMFEQSRMVDRALSRARSRNAQIVARNWPSFADEFARLGDHSDDATGPAYR